MVETSLIVGGTAGIGLEIAKALAARGGEVVITGRDIGRAKAVAATIGRNVRALAFDIGKPQEIGNTLADVKNVRNLVIGAIERDHNSVKDYNIQRAINLATMKLVGYAEVVHALVGRFTPDASIVLFGGLAKERPYPGSTTVTAVNGAVTSMVRAFATELAPMRCNAIHPGIIGDSPYWEGKAEALARTVARTPIGRLATMQEVTHATLFLLDNSGVNGVNLNVDGGWLLT